jgi:NTP pyrophosphatase (non-canonical NTP hydrolase)
MNAFTELCNLVDQLPSLIDGEDRVAVSAIQEKFTAALKNMFEETRQNLGNANVLARVQVEHAAWVRENFPMSMADPEDAFRGMVEELGELAHARRCHHQKIRGMDDFHAFRAAEEDALGDIQVFWIDYCTKAGYDAAKVLNKVWTETVRKRQWRQEGTDVGHVEPVMASNILPPDDRAIAAEVKSVNVAGKIHQNDDGTYTFTAADGTEVVGNTPEECASAFQLLVDRERLGIEVSASYAGDSAAITVRFTPEPAALSEKDKDLQLQLLGHIHSWLERDVIQSSAVAEERERCAKVCEAMVVGGRAWNEEQAKAAEVLFAAAKAIRGDVESVVDDDGQSQVEA